MFSEVQIYCKSAANSINKMRASDVNFQHYLDNAINSVKGNHEYQNMRYQDLVPITCKFAKENVQNDGDSMSDVNSVSWHLGIFCYIFRNSCPAANDKFDQLFIDSWEKLFGGETEIEALEILVKSFENLRKRIGQFNVSQVEEEVINQACKYIIENYGDELATVHDVSQIGSVNGQNLRFKYIINEFIEAATQIFPNEYKEGEKNAAFGCVLNNISWAGMWDHLRRYFFQKHGIRIDNELSADGLKTFSSTKHFRYINNIQVAESVVDRNINITFSNSYNKLLVGIEPSLSAKTGRLLKKNGNILVYEGDDPDYKFTIQLDEFEEVEKFILEMPGRYLRLEYY